MLNVQIIIVHDYLTIVCEGVYSQINLHKTTEKIGPHGPVLIVCLNLWLGEMCTDFNTDADADTDTRWTKHGCIRLFG